MKHTLAIFRVCLAATLAFLAFMPFSGVASGEEYAPDGVALTQTFRIRSAHDRTYLRANGQNIGVGGARADDDAILWVFEPAGWSGSRRTYRIANVATGWYLLRPRNSPAIYATVPQGHLADEWEIDEGPNGPDRISAPPLGSFDAPKPAASGVMLLSRPQTVYGGRQEADSIGLKREGGSAAGRAGASFADSKYVWHLEPYLGRDLITIEIESVKAIQTSTGRDGATDALTGSIVFALDWGPTIASSGLAGAAKNAVKGAIKKLGKEGGEEIAKKSFTEVAKEAFERAAKEGALTTAGRMARATGRGFVWAGRKSVTAGKWVSKTARKGVAKGKKVGSDWIKTKKTLLVRYKKNPKEALTWKNLGKSIWRSRTPIKIGIAAPETIRKLEKGWNDAILGSARLILDMNGNPVGVSDGTNAKSGIVPGSAGPGVARNPDIPVGLQSVAPDEHEFGLARIAFKALEVLEAPDTNQLIQVCESYEDVTEPPSPVNVVTPESAMELEDTFKELKGALAEAGAEKATEEVEKIVLDVFLDPFGTLMSNIVDLTNDTDDALEIELNGSSVWPNGGGDHRDISKGETKTVGVRRVLPRKSGVNIHLIEYDYASDDDNLGNLVFKTDGLREPEFHKEALVHSDSEGSLYGVTFNVRPFSGALTRQQEAASRAIEACNTVEKRQSDVEQAFSQLERYIKAMQSMHDKFGPEGIAVYDNSMAWWKSKTCPGKSADYKTLISGEWRVGRYSDITGEKQRDKTWTYTFTPDGKILTPRTEGTWQTTSNFNNDMWGRPRKDDYYTTPRSCNLYTALHAVDRLKGNDGDFGNYFEGRFRQFSETIMPVRSEAHGLTIYRYDRKSRTNDLLKFARDALFATDYTDENRQRHDAVPKAPGGLDVWMEKIDSKQAALTESPESIKKAEDFINGTFIFTRTTRDRLLTEYGRKRADEEKSYKIDDRWTFTSDNIFIAGNIDQGYYGGISTFGNIKDYNESIKKSYINGSKVSFATGTWKYIGDNRVKVIMDDKFNNSHGNFQRLIGKDEFVLNLGFEDSIEYNDGFYISTEYGKEYVAVKQCRGTKYNCLRHRYGKGHGADELEKVRIKLGLPVPAEEEEDYQRLLNERARTSESARIEELYDQEWDRHWALVNAQQVLWDQSALARRHYEYATSCGDEGRARKDEFIGEWTVGLVDRVGEKKPLPEAEAKWSFNENGTLTGAIDGKPWSAVWKANDGCSATVKFDADTAAHFDMETDVDIDLVYYQNGDKEVIFTERETATRISIRKLEDDTLVTVTEYNPRYKRNVTYEKLLNENFVHDRWEEVGDKSMSAYGTKSPVAEIKARYVLKYDQRIVTTAGLVNRCSRRWVNGEIRPGKQPAGRKVGFDLRSVRGPSYSQWSKLRLYKVNFEGPEAILLYEGTVGDTGKAWEAEIRTHAFDGAMGDEFVVADQETNCLKVYETAKLATTPIRDSFKFATNYEVVTSIYFDDDLTARRKFQGCEGYQWTSHARPLRSQVSRKIGNTNSYDIFVHAIDKDGKYLSQTPVLTVKPGTFETLTATEGERYPIFEKDFKCEAVAQIRSNRWDEIVHWEAAGWPQTWNPNNIQVATDNPQMIFGDGSVPITDPDHLDPDQIAGGCLDFGKTASKRDGAMRAGMRVGNSGPSTISVHWIDYNGKFDAGRPVFTLKPGQTGAITDYQGAKYQILDEAGKCVGIVEPAYVGSDKDAGELATFGDSSTRVGGDIIDRFELAGIRQPSGLTRRQVANGCNLYGKIASRPSWNGRSGKTIHNPGAKPLTVHWLSFYGTLADQENVRAAKPFATIMPGKSVTLPDGTDSDVHVVLEDGRQCVAVVRDSDEFADDWGVPGRVKKNLYSNSKNHYVLRDRKSAEAFETRVAEWKRDAAAHKKTVAGLEDQWARSNCGRSFSDVYSELRGVWEVGRYNRGARKQQFNTSPATWKFTEDFQLEGTDDKGNPFSSQVIPDNCTFRLGGSTGIQVKLIFHEDGTKELYTAPPRLPEILYDDGTIDTDQFNRDAKTEPKLDLWGKKLPTIGPIDDIDKRANEVDETARIGAPVGITVRAADPDDQVSYSIARISGGSHELFAVDPKTGAVTVAAPLDFETARSHALWLTATSADSTTSTKEFKIAVRAVNESAIGQIVNADKYRISDYSYGQYGIGDRLYENVKVGTPVAITAQAIDADGNDTVSYRLSDDAGGLFAIDPVSGVVTVAGKLDWETVKSHGIEVTASSSDGSTSRRRFEIPLADANEFDVGEIADRNRQPDVVDENAPVGTPVGITAFATDADGSATVSYSIEDNRNGSAFRIDPRTGVLTLNMELNREHFDKITVNVRATSTDSSTSEKVFTIAVNDVNEFGVGEIYNSRSSVLSVWEDAAIGEKIGLDAEARDEDATDTVTFSLGNRDPVPFRIDPVTGVVTVAASLSEAEIVGYVLEVVASSTDGSVSRKNFEVKVKDINEFPVGTVVDTDAIPNAIAESAPRGTRVGITAVADDPDGSDTVTYSLSGRFGPFAIDPKSGIITVSGDLDHETRPVETVEVVATSTDRSTNWAKFEVVVNDVNEGGIDYLEDTDIARDEVAENAPIGTPVGVTVFAKDFDSSDTVTYRMGADDDGLFAVDPNTGVVTVAAPIDYETTWSASPLIEAVSSDGSSRDRRFDIRILPVNEFDITHFVDTDPAPNEVSDSAAWNTPVGVTLSATDADEGSYKVEFAITDANGNEIYDGPFSIDNDGTIMTTDPRRLQAAGPGDYTLYVRGRSRDGSQRAELVAITIVGPANWYESPQDPRRDNDYSSVDPADLDACYARNEDRDSGVFNDENAFWNCADAAKEAARPKKWRDNPQGPRFEADYANVSKEAFEYCKYYDEDENSPDTYNNEIAYFDCLDRYRPVEPAPVEPQPTPVDQAMTPAQTCARQYGLEAEYSDQTGKVTITNNAASYIEVHRVDPSGGSELVFYLEQRQTMEINPDPRRSVVFVGLSPQGKCLGAGKPLESRNSFTFGSGGNGGAGDPEPTVEDTRKIEDYIAVPDKDYGICQQNHGHDASAFFDCMDEALKRLPTGTDTSDNTGDSHAEEPRTGGDDYAEPQTGAGCEANGQVASTATDSASVTFTNTGSADLSVYWFSYDGVKGNYESQAVALLTVAPGQTENVGAYIGYAFAVEDSYGNCLGVARVGQAAAEFAYGGQ